MQSDSGKDVYEIVSTADWWQLVARYNSSEGPNIRYAAGYHNHEHRTRLAACCITDIVVCKLVLHNISCLSSSGAHFHKSTATKVAVDNHLLLFSQAIIC